MTHVINIQIVRFVDPSQPGFVECVLRDTSNREWSFIEKVPVVCEMDLDGNSVYPQPGVIACEIVRQWIDEQGRARCLVDTERTWGVEAKDGESQFEVFHEQMTTRPY